MTQVHNVGWVVFHGIKNVYGCTNDRVWIGFHHLRVKLPCNTSGRGTGFGLVQYWHDDGLREPVALSRTISFKPSTVHWHK